LSLGEGFRERLAVNALQLRLVIETFQMRRPAGHAQMNDALGSHGKMGRVHDAFPAPLSRRCFGAADQFGVEEASQGDTAQAVGGTAQEGAAIYVELKLLSIKWYHKSKAFHSVFRYRLVQIQDHAANLRPRRQFG